MNSLIITKFEKIWKLNGNKHRKIKPAVDYFSGNKEWFTNGLINREDDLPAIEYTIGDKEWWSHGSRHRDNGAAITSDESNEK